MKFSYLEWYPWESLRRRILAIAPADDDEPADLSSPAQEATSTGDKWPPVSESFAANWLTNGAVLHPLTVNLVVRFARALAQKLAAAEVKHGYSDEWCSKDWMVECRAKLTEHIAKGDPRDVAAYCAFLWHHGESTARETTPISADDVAEPGLMRMALQMLYDETADLIRLNNLGGMDNQSMRLARQALASPPTKAETEADDGSTCRSIDPPEFVKMPVGMTREQLWEYAMLCGYRTQLSEHDRNRLAAKAPTPQALTPETAKKLWLACTSIDNEAFCVEFTRAIEAAHGISS